MIVRTLGHGMEGREYSVASLLLWHLDSDKNYLEAQRAAVAQHTYEFVQVY